MLPQHRTLRPVPMPVAIKTKFGNLQRHIYPQTTADYMGNSIIRVIISIVIKRQGWGANTRNRFLVPRAEERFPVPRQHDVMCLRGSAGNVHFRIRYISTRVGVGDAVKLK